MRGYDRNIFYRSKSYMPLVKLYEVLLEHKAGDTVSANSRFDFCSMV